MTFGSQFTCCNLLTSICVCCWYLKKVLWGETLHFDKILIINPIFAEPIISQDFTLTHDVGHEDNYIIGLPYVCDIIK